MSFSMPRSVAGSGIDGEMNIALEEYMQKLRRLADAHIAAAGVEALARERALDERERQLNEREQAFDARSKLPVDIVRANKEPHFSPLKEPDFSPLKEAIKLRDEALRAMAPINHEPILAPVLAKMPQLGFADKEQASIKTGKGVLTPAESTETERAKIALMVPSPTRARAGSIPPPARVGSNLSATNGSGTVAPLRPVMRTFGAFSPRTSHGASPPPPMPCSPPVAMAVASPTPMLFVACESGVSLLSEEGRKMSGIAERKEKLLMALTSSLAASPGDESCIMNSSVMSTPGRVRADSGIAAKQKDRKSLAELLQEDEARLAELVR